MKETRKNDWSEWTVRRAGGVGDAVTLEFDGTGIALVGDMAQDGGRADVFLDGKKAETPLDAWIPARTYDYDLWHVTGLPAGRHVVRIVVRGDADERSTGRAVRIERAVVYGEAPSPSAAAGATSSTRPRFVARTRTR